MNNHIFLLFVIFSSTSAMRVFINSQNILSPATSDELSKKYQALKKHGVKEINVQVSKYWEDDFVVQNHVICQSGFTCLSHARSTTVLDACELGVEKLKKCMQKDKENPQLIYRDDLCYIDM